MNNVTLDAWPADPKFEKPITARPHRLHLLVENKTESLQLDWGLIYVMTMSFIYLLCPSFMSLPRNKQKGNCSPFDCSKLCSLRHRQYWTLVKSVFETAPKSLFRSLISVPGFEYVQWVTCWKSHCRFASQYETKRETHFGWFVESVGGTEKGALLRRH